MRRGLARRDRGELAVCERAVNKRLNHGVEPRNLLLAVREPDVATGGATGQDLDLILSVVLANHRVDGVASVEAADALVGQPDQTIDRRPFAGDLARVWVTGAEQLVEHVYPARAVVVSLSHRNVGA